MRVVDNVAEVPVLRVRNLQTQFQTSRGLVRAVDGVSFDLYRGEALGLVGESGSGKSVTCLSLLRMVPKPGGEITGGSVELNGRNLVELSDGEMAEVRGHEIGMIMQDPMTSLDPLFTIGDQISEALSPQADRGSGSLRERVIHLLELVHIPAPKQRVRSYPHQLSGGMRQRVVAAIAFAGKPAVLLADEPTTSLDVTIQVQFLELLKQLQRAQGVALVLVTHDLSIVARSCDRVAVMYAGRIIELASTLDLFEHPHHPYTRGLLRSVPRLGVFPERLSTIEGQTPDLATLPSGCPFRERCPDAMAICTEQYPEVRDLGGGHISACWLEPAAEQAPAGSVQDRARSDAFRTSGSRPAL